MGKKGSWFSAIKKVFTQSSSKKLAYGVEKKSSNEETKKKEKKGFGKFKHVDGRSFIPLFRKPSSIEEILGEAEREHHIINYKPLIQPDHPKAPPHATVPPPPPQTATPSEVVTHLRIPTSSRSSYPPVDVVKPIPQLDSPPQRRVASPSRNATHVNVVVPAGAPSTSFVQKHRLEPTVMEKHNCAVKIQAAYRGYMARRSYGAVRGLLRLQEVVKGRSVKRQTANALKCMQLLVRLQAQIQSRRIQTYENQAVQRQDDKDTDSIFSKWNVLENQDKWDDSMLTKEEVNARRRKKVEAIVNRERAMAYSHSYQSRKSAPRMAQSALKNIRPGGFPSWWNWSKQRHDTPPKTPTNHSQTLSVKSFHLTPTRTSLESKPSSPLPQARTTLGQLVLGLDNLSTPSPRSTKSAIPTRTKLSRTPTGKLQHKFTRHSAANSPFSRAAFRDDDSLTSCPPFSVPRYMSPTVSAKAKVRGSKEPFPDSPSSTWSVSTRRVSFPLSHQESRWNKEGGSKRSLMKKHSLHSVGNMNVDSTVSTVVSASTVGRRPFNRFV